jgi:putative ABC transport system substrate-binding protein
MAIGIARRKFIAALGGTAVAWPLAARAQQPVLPVIGYLSGRSQGEAGDVLTTFRDGLNEAGFVERRDVAIEYRWAERQFDRLPDMAAELVRHQVAVIVATGGDLSPIAAKAATSTIPIVFLTGVDPVELGLVTRINRPDGNVTGVTLLAVDLEGKRLGLLRELVPAAAIFAALLNPNATLFDAQSRGVDDAAAAAGRKIEVLKASNERQIDAAFAAAAHLRVDALLVGADPFFNSRQEQLITLAARYSLPAIFSFREFANLGGLMSYGTSFTEGYRQVGNYTGRILNGTKPGDLPVVLPTKYELVINLKTANVLSLTVPPTLLGRADSVIE